MPGDSKNKVKKEIEFDIDKGRDSGFVPDSRPTRKTTGQEDPCADCGEINWSTDETRGEVHCASCGLVVEQDVIDPGAEWSNHGDGTDKSRVGAPPTFALSDKGLNTVIDRKDLRGSRASRLGMNARGRRDWNRRAVIDSRSKNRSSRSRNLTKAMQFIRNCSDLPKNLQEEAAFYYRKAVDKGVVTGRSIAGVSAACTYLAAREAGLPRSIIDLAKSFAVGEKELKRTIRIVSRVLGAHHVTSPVEYFDLFHNKLQLPPAVLMQTHELWDSVKHLDVWQGKKPSGVAGVILYKSSQLRGHPRTQAEVCKVVGVSEVTLRGLLRLLESAMNSVGEGTTH